MKVPWAKFAEEIEKRWLKNVNTAAVSLVSHLSLAIFRQTAQKLPQCPDHEVKAELHQLASNVRVYLRVHIESPDFLRNLDIEYDKFMLRQDQYMMRGPVDSLGEARNYWRRLQMPGDSCVLATVALAALGMNPSEASVERSFSAQKEVHSKRRNRLAHESVQATMLVRINTPLLEDKRYDYDDRLYADDSDDDDDDENSSSISVPGDAHNNTD